MNNAVSNPDATRILKRRVWRNDALRQAHAANKRLENGARLVGEADSSIIEAVIAVLIISIRIKRRTARHTQNLARIGIHDDGRRRLRLRARHGIVHSVLQHVLHLAIQRQINRRQLFCVRLFLLILAKNLLACNVDEYRIRRLLAFQLLVIHIFNTAQARIVVANIAKYLGGSTLLRIIALAFVLKAETGKIIFLDSLLDQLHIVRLHRALQAQIAAARLAKILVQLVSILLENRCQLVGSYASGVALTKLFLHCLRVLHLLRIGNERACHNADRQLLAVAVDNASARTMQDTVTLHLPIGLLLIGRAADNLHIDQPDKNRQRNKHYHQSHNPQKTLLERRHFQKLLHLPYPLPRTTRKSSRLVSGDCAASDASRSSSS